MDMENSQESMRTNAMRVSCNYSR